MATSRRFKWIALGCLAFAVVGAGVVALGVWRSVSFVQDLGDQFGDPQRAADRTREILDTHRLPVDWNPGFAATIPLLGDVVMMRRPFDGQGPDDRGWFFFYLNLRGKPDDPADWDASEDEIARVLRRQGMRLRRGTILDRGAFPVGPDHVDFMVAEGVVEQNTGNWEGVVAMVQVTCVDPPRRNRTRMGLILGPTEAVPVVEGTLRIAGTPLDRRELQAALDSIGPCSR